MVRYFYTLLLLFAGCADEHQPDSPIYRPFSKAVIHLVFENHTENPVSASAFAVTNIPIDASESRSIPITQAGDYYLELLIDRPVKASLEIDSTYYNVFVMPEDTTHITVTPASDGVNLTFSGFSKPMNDYYAKKSKALGYTDVRYPLNQHLSSTTTYQSLKMSTDSIINHELAYLKKYSSSFELPDWFLKYEDAEITYTGAGFKTQMPLTNQIMNFFADSVPGDYYDFLNAIEIANVDAIMSSQYLFFLDAYFLVDFPMEYYAFTGSKRKQAIRSHILKKANRELSGKVKEIYNTYSFSSLITFYSDSAAIDSVARQFGIANDYRELIRVSGTRSQDEMPVLNLHVGDTIADFVLSNTMDSLTSIRDYRDKVLYLNFWATWCGPCIKNMPKLNELIANFEDHPDVEFLNICIDSEKEKWLESLDRYKISGVNLIAEGSWNSKLKAYFNIKGVPYYVLLDKGNVLYENSTEKAPEIQTKLRGLATKHQH